MTREQILVVLIEECGEVIQAAIKCLRFGWDREHPDYGVNHEVLAMELGDVLGAADALNLRQDFIEACRRVKMSKVERVHTMFGVSWREGSVRKCGDVQETAAAQAHLAQGYALHTGGVTGSIPVAPTIDIKDLADNK